jgi:Domain of unknown function (DUF1887)
MATILVTLVSDQALPNVQYIKEFQPSDGYLFISTLKMEEKKQTQHILDACCLERATVRQIIVNEESFSDIQAQLAVVLEDPLFVAATQIIVNCTLGTKVMSIALFDYFKNNDKARILYSPIGTNKYRSITGAKEEQLFRQKITIEEYLKSYGIGLNRQGSTTYSFDYTKQFFDQFLHFTPADFKELDFLRGHESSSPTGKLKIIKGRDKGIKNIDDRPSLRSFLQKITFISLHDNDLSSKEVKYITGGWFEEWTYFKIKEALDLENTQIAIGLESRNTADNDLDVVFIWKNDIYIIECKTLLGKDLQQSTLYKSGALVDKFGRAAKSYLFTLSDLRKEGKLLDAVELRARQQNVIVLDRTDLLTNFEDFIQKLKN